MTLLRIVLLGDVTQLRQTADIAILGVSDARGGACGGVSGKTMLSIHYYLSAIFICRLQQ